jgi:hypothetical protein
MRYAHHHPAFDAIPGITHTAIDMPGDPLNVSLIGTEAELKKLMLAASWYPADSLTWHSCLEIAEASVLKRPYDDAPVSSLYLFGRREDLAFEQEVGGSAKQRNHVRFWRAAELVDGRPLWLGAATFDRGVGLSHRTGQITHHIGPDVDAERDRVIADLKRAGQLRTVFQVTGVGPKWRGRNGGGDPYFTDGELDVGMLKTADAGRVTTPDVLPNPPALESKRRIWEWLGPMLRAVYAAGDGSTSKH